MIKLFKKFLLFSDSQDGASKALEGILLRYAGAVQASLNWDYSNFSCKILMYLEKMKIGKKAWEYGFCDSQRYASIYSAAYALMIKSFFYGTGAGLSAKERNEYIEYFLGYQDSKTGYFIDPSLEDGDYINMDNENNLWWGYGHVLLHVIPCLQILNIKPAFKFKYLEQYFNENTLLLFLDSLNWDTRTHYTGNILMNIGIPLQYQALILNDKESTVALRALQNWLYKNADSETCLWGKLNINNSTERSIAIQAAYHFWPLFTFESIKIKYNDKTIQAILNTQNKLGGYGLDNFASNGCEDIDSIEPLARFYPLVKGAMRDKILYSLRFALPWVLANQNQDGGFVFSLNSPLHYGHPRLTSLSGESNLFATWWRTLTIAYLSKSLGMPEDFYLVDAPGLCFPIREGHQ